MGVCRLRRGNRPGVHQKKKPKKRRIQMPQFPPAALRCAIIVLWGRRAAFCTDIFHTKTCKSSINWWKVSLCSTCWSLCDLFSMLWCVICVCCVCCWTKLNIRGPCDRLAPSASSLYPTSTAIGSTSPAQRKNAKGNSACNGPRWTIEMVGWANYLGWMGVRRRKNPCGVRPI